MGGVVLELRSLGVNFLFDGIQRKTRKRGNLAQITAVVGGCMHDNLVSAQFVQSSKKKRRVHDEEVCLARCVCSAKKKKTIQRSIHFTGFDRVRCLSLLFERGCRTTQRTHTDTLAQARVHPPLPTPRETFLIFYPEHVPDNFLSTFALKVMVSAPTPPTEQAQQTHGRT